MCSLLSGNKFLLTVLNRLGICASYSTLQKLRKSIANSEASKPIDMKVRGDLLLEVAWDNIDSKLSRNAQRRVGKKVDWHGTVLISEQMPQPGPLLSKRPFRKIDIEQFPTAKGLVTSLVNDVAPVKSFNVMFLSLAAVFRRNLKTADPKNMVSMDLLLKMALQGRCTGQPALISNLQLLDRPSNDSDTAEYIMREMQRLVLHQSEQCGDHEAEIRYCTVCSDGPLYAQVKKIERDSFTG